MNGQMMINLPSKKKKKPPKNAFAIFMFEIKNKRGITTAEAATVAGELWPTMTDEQKKKYYNVATQEKQLANGDPNTKFTSLGVSFAQVDEEQRRLIEKERIISQTIKNMVGGLNSSTIKSHKFYLCHVNYSFKHNGKHIPAEIALIEFSLQEGITNSFHAFLQTGQLPLGMRRQAMERTTNIHGIPLLDSQCSNPLLVTSDYDKVCWQIVQFVTQYRKTEPIFTMVDNENSNYNLSAVVDALELLCEARGESSEVFRVLPLTKLFFELKNKCAEGRSDMDKFPSAAIVEGVIEKDVFSYASEIACEFHETLDEDGTPGAINCSLSFVTRWAYIICDHCCRLLQIPLVPGCHCPKDTDTSWQMKCKQEYASASNHLTFHDRKRIKEEQGREYDEKKKVLEETKEAPLPARGFRDPEMYDLSDFPMLGSSGRGAHAYVSDQPVFWPVAHGRGRGCIGKK